MNSTFIGFLFGFFTGFGYLAIFWGVFAALKADKKRRIEFEKTLDDKTYRKYMEMRGF